MFKANNKDVISPTKFCLGSTYEKLSQELGEVLSKGNVYDFSVDYNVFAKSGNLNIHQYLMIKNNIKQYKIMFRLIKWVFIAL